MLVALLIPAVVVVVSLLASRHAAHRFQAAMARGAKMRAPKARTGTEIAQLYLQFEGAEDVEVVPHQGLVTDYFDPKRRRLFLSRRVADSTSLAAWAVALHEAGHATQTGGSLGDLKWRQTCIRLTRYGPMFAALLLALLMVLKVLNPRLALIAFGALWALFFLLNVGTLAIEWNANLRLRRFLDQHLGDYPDAREELDRLLATVATREVGDLVNSPRYFFLSALPGTTRLRPGEGSAPKNTPPDHTKPD